MKLLTHKEIDRARQHAIDKEVIRGAMLSQGVDKERKRYNEAREKARDELIKLQKGLLAFSEEVTNEKRQLNNELEILREEKKELIKPVDKLIQEAEMRLQEAQDIKEESEEGMNELRQSKEEISTRIEALMDKESRVNEKDEDLTEREFGVRRQESMAKSSMDHAVKSWRELELEKVKVEKIIKKQRDDLQKKGEEVSAQLIVIKERTTDLEKRESLLQSRQQTLKQAYEQLGRK